MDIQHVNAKLFFDGAVELGGMRFVEIFHAWVREQSMDEVLVDVADYRHVPDGPALMVVGHEADYVIDFADGRGGLRYNRKAEVSGSNADRFHQAAVAVSKAAKVLVEAAGEPAIGFDGSELVITINDRALAPNSGETFATLLPDIEAGLSGLVGEMQIERIHGDDERRLFGAIVKPANPFDPTSLV